MRVDFSAGGPPAERLPNWEDRGPATQRRCPVRPGPACRFDEPSGGTEEFLGRRVTRLGSRRAEAKGALADPLYVFGAVGRAVGNRNDRTSRCRQEERALGTRDNRFKTEVGQVGNSGVRALTLVSIYGFGASNRRSHALYACTSSLKPP